jgi:uroporphyrinogen-III synthase
VSDRVWVRISPLDHVPVREGRACTIAGREIAIFNLGDRCLAVDNRCPHKEGPLADGIVAGDSVVCPLHGWKIQLDTGAVERPADTSAQACVAQYPVRIEDGIIVIGLPVPARDTREGEAAYFMLRRQLHAEGRRGTTDMSQAAAKPGSAGATATAHDRAPEATDVDGLHEIGSRLAAADPLHDVLSRVVQFVSSMVRCDSCFVYVLEGDALVLRASKNPHLDAVDRLSLRVGQGITGWVAEHLEPVAIAESAFADPRFKVFNELPEDRYQAFLSVPVLSHGKLVGVINVQHRQPHHHRRHEIRLISTVGFLVGAEIEMARLDSANLQLAQRLEERKLLERAKGILQRDLGLTEEEAYLTIQKHSRQRRKSKREIAEAIMIGEDLPRSAHSG